MSFLDNLIAAQESPVAAWLQFALTYKAGSSAYYAFLEGRLDIPFYRSAMRSVFGAECQVVEFRCGGKDGVIVIRGQVRKSHPECKRCIFFVDKDLGDVLGETSPSDADTFSTDVYSIENYFVSEEALGVIWNEIWGLSYNDYRWEPTRKQFRDAHMRFCKAITPLMSWIILARRVGDKPNLNNLHLHRIISFDDNLIPSRKTNSKNEVQNSSGCKFSPTLCDLLHQARQLKALAPKSLVRGKFELWFFTKFLEGLQKAARTVGPKPGTAIPSSPESLAIILCGKVTVPVNLRRFLESKR